MSDESIKEKIEQAMKTIQEMAAVTDVRVICQPWIYTSMKMLVEKLELNNNVEICPVVNILPKYVVAAIIDKDYKGW